MTRTLLLLLLSCVSGFSQIISAGIRGGVPLTDFLNTVQSAHISYFTHTNRYIVGPTVEVHLPFRLGLEVDALYRHLNYQSTSLGVDTFSSASATANAFEFPILAKYRFPIKVINPFIDAGFAFDTLQGLTESITNRTLIGGGTTTTTSTSNPSELKNTTTRGIVFGGGLNILLLVVHIMPEIRYTHWNQEHFTVGGLLHSNVNQGEFLLGITF